MENNTIDLGYLLWMVWINSLLFYMLFMHTVDCFFKKVAKKFRYKLLKLEVLFLKIANKIF